MTSVGYRSAAVNRVAFACGRSIRPTGTLDPGHRARVAVHLVCNGPRAGSSPAGATMRAWRKKEDALGSDPGGLTPLRVRPSPPAPGTTGPYCGPMPPWRDWRRNGLLHRRMLVRIEPAAVGRRHIRADLHWRVDREERCSLAKRWPRATSPAFDPLPLRPGRYASLAGGTLFRKQ